MRVTRSSAATTDDFARAAGTATPSPGSWPLQSLDVISRSRRATLFERWTDARRQNQKHVMLISHEK
jgi:hypothetical protein